jgi:hypothetical protein
MSKLKLTGHAVVRMAQRGIKTNDAELIVLIGTEVEGGYFVRDQDCQRAERQVSETLRHIRGKRLVVADGQVVTGYHASSRRQRRLLRNAHKWRRRLRW